jgi:hypothetical protein
VGRQSKLGQSDPQIRTEGSELGQHQVINRNAVTVVARANFSPRWVRIGVRRDKAALSNSFVLLDLHPVRDG